MESRFWNSLLMRGQTRMGIGLGTVLAGGWFWMRTAGCCILYRGDGCNQTAEEFVTTVNRRVSRVTLPGWVGHEAGVPVLYLLRRVGGSGIEEKSYAGSLHIIADESGVLISQDMNPVLGLQAVQEGSNVVRLSWSYCPSGQRVQPARFVVLMSSNSGEELNEVASTEYEGQRSYEVSIGSLESGSIYFVVAAESPDGDRGPAVTCDVKTANLVHEPLECVSVKLV